MNLKNNYKRLFYAAFQQLVCRRGEIILGDEKLLPSCGASRPVSRIPVYNSKVNSCKHAIEVIQRDFIKKQFTRQSELIFSIL